MFTPAACSVNNFWSYRCVLVDTRQSCGSDSKILHNKLLHKLNSCVPALRCHGSDFFRLPCGELAKSWCCKFKPAFGSTMKTPSGRFRTLLRVPYCYGSTVHSSAWFSRDDHCRSMNNWERLGHGTTAHDRATLLLNSTDMETILLFWRPVRGGDNCIVNEHIRPIHASTWQARGHVCLAERWATADGTNSVFYSVSTHSDLEEECDGILLSEQIRKAKPRFN